MDDSRTDAPKFDLTAQPSEDEDVLQAETTDLSSGVVPAQKKKPEVRPTPPNPELDAKLFNALVSPVAPVRLSEPSESARRPAPVAPPETPIPPAAAPLEAVSDGESPDETAFDEEVIEIDPLTVEADSAPAADADPDTGSNDPREIEVEALEADSVEEVVDVTVVDAEETFETEADEFVSDPILLVQPDDAAATPSVHDWEPLPPLMRIVAGEDETDDRSTGDQPVPETEAHELAPEVDEISEEHGLVAHATTWDPAAVEDRPEQNVHASPVAATPASPEQDDAEDEHEPKHDDDRVAAAEMFSARPIPRDEIEADEPMPAPEPLLTASSEDLGPASDVAPAPVAPAPTPGRTGAWWTLPMICLGLMIVACAVLVPAADENRRDLHELAKLEQDVAYFQKQSEVNKQFLEHVSTDPTLAERLAQRQLRMTRADSRVVQMSKERGPFSMSPYALVTITPPTPMPEYQPMGGFLSRYFLDTKGQIYLTGLGILLVAAGVILGGGEPRRVANDE